MAWCDVVEPCTLRECRISLGQAQAAFAATLGARKIIAIVMVGVALAGVIFTSARGVRQDINELRGEIGKLRERMAHLEGLMEGLRESIVGRSRAS